MNKLFMFINYIIKVGLIIQLNIGALMLLGIIVTITAGIVSRYVFNAPYIWTEELGIFMFTWLSFMGASVAAARNKHVAVRLLTSKLSLGKAKYVKLLSFSLTLVFLGFLVLGALYLQPQTAKHSSIVLGIPKNFYYLPVLIAGIYISLVLIRDSISYLFDFDHPYKEQIVEVP